MSSYPSINLNNLPQHIAIIMDGNGRWAKGKGKLRVFGHSAGVTPVREASELCAELGVKYLTLYAFSTENWSRPKAEIDALMALLVKTIRKETKTLIENNIRLYAIGDIKSLPLECQEELSEAIEITKHNTRMQLNLALSYGSRWEIVEAIKRAAAAGEDMKNFTAQTLEKYLETAGMPDPELLIRTSGEYRISNFMLWQIAYAEIVILEKLWPDVRKADLIQAIEIYQKRERRFGGVEPVKVVESTK
ncbi:MAG: isoprenyl transferase [Bacteroidia bacterium]|nr:isoprenyl transferase [Bacteroidia bacterium]MDW8347231.1 isoprenyl transferase [Bacteroidia bacterium]